MHHATGWVQLLKSGRVTTAQNQPLKRQPNAHLNLASLSSAALLALSASCPAAAIAARSDVTSDCRDSSLRAAAASACLQRFDSMKLVPFIHCYSKLT